VEPDSLAGLYVDKEDGVVALVAHGLRVRVNEPGLLHGVGDDEDDLPVGNVGDLECLLDDAYVPAEELLVIDALFAMFACMLALDEAEGAIVIGLLIRTGEGVERIGEDAAVLIDVDPLGSVESVGAVISRTGGLRGLLGKLLGGERCQRGRKEENGKCLAA
jgi:hypothetical protein